MKLMMIFMLFVVSESFGQKDSVREEQVIKLLQEKGWSLSSSNNPGNIRLDDNGIEFFPDFFFNNYILSTELRKNRIKYPLSYLAFGKEEALDEWDKIQKDSLIDIGKPFVFIPTHSSRIIIWEVKGKIIQNIFTIVDRRWYLTKIVVTVKE